MDFILNFIHWSPDPVIFEIGSRGIRWYGLLLATGFLLSYFVLGYLLKKESWVQQRIDALAIYTIVGVVVGLRLGHCLFYDPVHYLSHPLEILKVWEGGLASHGGAVGIILALLLFARKYKLNFWYLIDRVAAVVLLAGSFVRVGNLMNSEIYGVPTKLPWGFQFFRVGDDAALAMKNAVGQCNVADVSCLAQHWPARHPTQLYEGIFYFIAFFVLLWLFKRYKDKWKPGVFLGIFLNVVFVFRFFIEFTKESQIEFEGWNFPLDMGQLLSVPFVALGLWLIFRKRPIKT